MSKITCALSGPQIENLFKLTYKSMKNALEAGEAFNADLFMSDLFKKIAAKKDLATAILFVQQAPSLMYTAAGQSNLLALDFVGDTNLRKLMREYKDPTNGFNLVLATYAPDASAEEILQATVVQNSLIGKPTLDGTSNPPTGSAEVERMKPFTTFTSTFMEFIKLNPKDKGILTKEKIDPNRMRIYNTISKIKDSIPADVTPFTEVNYKGKVIKLKAIKLTKLDQNMLDETTKNEIIKSFSITPKNSKKEVFFKGEMVVQADDRVALVLCSAGGDFIYFDEDGNISSKEEGGKLVYQFTRNVRQDRNNPSALRTTDIYGKEDQIMTPEELFAAEARHMDLSVDQYEKVLEEGGKSKKDRIAQITDEQQKEFRELKAFNESITKKGETYELPVTGVSLGIPTNLVAQGPSIGQLLEADLINRENFKSIKPIKEPRDGFKGGTNIIKINGQEFALDRPSMTEDIAKKVAHMLTNPKISIKDKLLYMSYFMNNELSNGVKRYEIYNNQTTKEFAFKIRPFTDFEGKQNKVKNTPKEVSLVPENYQMIFDALFTQAYSYKGEYFPSKMIFNEEAIHNDTFYDYNIETGSFNTEPSSYINLIQTFTETEVKLVEDKDPGFFNSYMHFSIDTKFTEEVKDAAANAKSNPTIAEKKAAIAEALKKGAVPKGTVAKLINAAGYQTQTQWVFTDVNGSTVNFYNHEGNITDADQTAQARLVLLESFTGNNGTLYTDPIGVFIGDKFIGFIQENKYSLGDAAQDAEATGETPITDREAKENEIVQRATNLSITQEQVNDLLAYDSGTGTILEQATRLIDNYNRIFDVQAKVTDFKGNRLYIKIGNFETSIDAEAVKLGGKQLVFSIDQTGISELINAKFSAELAALEETEEEDIVVSSLNFSAVEDIVETSDEQMLNPSGVAQPSDEDEGIPDFGFNRSAELPNSVTQEQIDAAKEWWNSSPLSKFISIEHMANIVNSNVFARFIASGKTLATPFNLGKIQINEATNGNYVDVYHEAWHVFSQLFLTKNQKLELYNEVRNSNPKWKTLSFLQIEEMIAEDFRSYALDPKPADAMPKRNSIFRRILNFLKKLFGKKANINNTSEVTGVKEMFEKLYFSNKNPDLLKNYKPLTENVMWDILNRGPQAVNNKDAEFLSSQDGKLVSASIDSIFSTLIDRSAKQTGNKAASMAVLSDAFLTKDGVTNKAASYSYAKDKLTARLKSFTEEALAIGLPKSLEQQNRLELLNDNIRVLTATLDNWGDANSGMIKYHTDNSTFAILNQKVIMDENDPANEEQSSPEDAKNTERFGDKGQGEKSLTEMASSDTLFILKSIFRVDSKGNKVTNRLGFDELADFPSVWNNVVRAVGSEKDPAVMQQKLERAAITFPELRQLIDYKLPDLANPKSPLEMKITSAFWQDFRKSRISYVQLTMFKQEDNSYIAEVTEASNETTSLIYQFRNKFKAALEDEYTAKTVKNTSLLKLDAIVKEFGKRGSFDSSKSYKFARAIGIALDDLTIIKKDLETRPEYYGLQYIYGIVKKFSEIENDPKASREAIKYLKEFKEDPINTLSNPIPAGVLGAKEFDEKNLIVKLAELQGRYGKDASNFSVLNAERNLVFEHIEDFSASLQVGAINDVNDLSQLWTTNKYQFMSYLDPAKNPFTRRSKVLDSIFKVNTAEDQYGRRNDRTLVLNAVSGTQVDDKVTGANTTSLDKQGKFIQEMHMMLKSGLQEFMRHASKSSSFGVRVEGGLVIGRGKGKDNNLYVDIDKFATANDAELFAIENIFTGYIASELERIIKFKSNIDEYKNFAGYNRVIKNKDGKEIGLAGEFFTAFDNVLREDTKKALLENIDQMDTRNVNFLQNFLSKNPKIKEDVIQDITDYFNEQTEANNEFLNNKPYVEQALLNRLSLFELTPEETQRTLVKAYTYNSWIHNFEMAHLFYGDLTQFNHSKDEGHKRIPGATSGGNGFRTDIGAQNYINDILNVSKKDPVTGELIPATYAAVLNKRYNVERYKNINYNGTFNTAILQDIERVSKYSPVIEKALREDYKTRFKNAKKEALLEQFSKTERKSLQNSTVEQLKEKLIDKRIKSEMKAYNKMEEGDGQGYVTIDAYRALKVLEGSWSPEQDALYQKVIAGKEITPQEVIKFLPPYKVQNFGPLANAPMTITAMHKFSLMPLIPTMIKGSDLESMHEQMLANDIQYITFQSGSKVGSITANGKPDKIYDDADQKSIIKPDAAGKGGIQFTKNTIYLEYLKNVTNVPEKRKKQTIFSTQLRKLILEGLYENGVVRDSRFNPYVDAYENAVKDYSRVIRLEILNEIGYERNKDGKYEGKLDKFLEVVQNELSRKEVPEHLIEYIGVTPQGKVINDLSYHLEADEIEKILVSLINKRLTKQKVKGEALVQVASSMTNGMWSPSPNMTKATEEEIRKYMGTNNLPFYDNEGGIINFDKLYKTKSKDALKDILAQKEKVLEDQARYWTPTYQNNLRAEIQYLKDVIAGKKPSITEVTNPTSAMKVAVAMQGDFTNLFNAKGLDGDTIGIYDEVTVTGKDGKEKIVKKLRFQESLDRLNALIKNDEWLNTGNNRKLITMTAVRIPVQGLNSMEFMEVHHFLVPEAGNIIIPPTELVAKSGADYDIDKLTTFMPSIDSDGRFIESLMSVDEVERLVKEQAQDSSQAARIIATQKSAIENRLIQSTKDILSLPENFANLVRPNDTYLLKDIADELEERVTEYNKYSTAHGEGPRYDGDKKVISPTKMLEVGFNVHKQDVNMGGKDGLGIVALKNALHPIFVAIGGKMPKTYKASTWDDNLKRYVETNVDHDMRLLMRHNTLKGSISLSNIYDVDNIDRVSDLFNHKMNGLVDVEKDSWIFNIQGNVEVIPVLSYLFMAGVPRQLAVKFVSQPLVRQYVERQRILNSPYSKVTGDTPEFSAKSQSLADMAPSLSAAVSNKANMYKLIDAIKTIEKDAFVITTKANPEKNIQATTSQISKEELIKRLEHKDSNFQNIAKVVVVGGKKNLAVPVDKSPFSATNYYYTAKASSEVAQVDNFSLDMLDDIVDTSDTTSPEAVAAFAHFIEIERQISGLEALQRVANPDTKTFKTIEEILQREYNLTLVSEMSKLDPELVKNLMDESILSEFYDNELVKQLLEPLFILRNNKKVSAFITTALEDYRNTLTGKYGTGEDATRMFINQFKNAIVNYAYQNYMTNSIDFNGKIVDYPEMYNDLEVVMGKDIPNGAKIVGDKIYLDMDVLNLDFSEKRYMNNSSDDNSYTKRGLNGFGGTKDYFQSKSSFIKYVMEREYLRRSAPLESLATNKDYTGIKKLFKKVITDDEVATKKAYESYLNQQALFNTFNRRALMIVEDFSFTDHFFNVINDEAYTFLKDKYPVLNQFTEPKIFTKEKVITINNKNIIKGDVAEGYYQNLVDLADPNVKKVIDTVDNKRLSDLFKLLPLVALYTHGIGYSKEGMNKILPYENFMDKIFDASRIFAANNLTTDTFKDIFNKLVTNSTSTFKDYVTPITETPQSEELPVEPPIEVRTTASGGLQFGATPKVAGDFKDATTPVMEISPNSKGLGAGLSIQTVLARSKGNIVSEYPVTFQGTEYLDADQALQLNYKKYKVDGTGPMTIYSLMVDIMTEKFKQHPKLVDAITKQGGSKLLMNAIFQPTQRNDMWETGGKNYMVLALNEAYLNVIEPESKSTPAGDQSRVVADIPQNKVSGVESYGSTVTANDDVIKALGTNPHSIDMIEAGLRTRTTRSESEMAKYAIKVGDRIKHFGKSADGSTKTIYATVTAIHPIGSPEWKGTWAKEGWRAEDVNVIDRFKTGAAAIEFEIENPVKQVTQPTVQSTTQSTENVLPGVEIKKGAITGSEELELFNILKPYLEAQGSQTNKGTDAPIMIGLGLRWDYTSNNPGKKPVELGETINNSTYQKNKYRYYDVAHNGQPLGAISQRLKDLVTKATGIDTSNYDGAIINVYPENGFISAHNDVDESVTAINYPVLVVNMGGSGNLSVEGAESQKAKKSYADKVYTNINLNSGDAYIFGEDGINRDVYHRTLPSSVKGTLPQLNIQGKSIPANSYRITITLRRVKPLEAGMPTAPAKVSSVESATTKLSEAEKFDLGSYIVQMQFANNGDMQVTVSKWLDALSKANSDLTKESFNDMLDQVLTNKLIKSDAEGVIEYVRNLGNAWFDGPQAQPVAEGSPVSIQPTQQAPVAPTNTEEGSILTSRAAPLAYTSLQVKALNEVGALIDRRRDGFYLLAGYAGTGKTTIAENIARYAKSKNYGVEVIAPTNKAAKVLATKLKEAGVGNIKPNTIHGTIYMTPDEETQGWKKKPPVNNKVFIIDEASMIDDKLMSDIIDYVKDRNNIVIFMGDGFQLEQIGTDSGLFRSLKDPNVFNEKYGVSLDGGIMLTEVRRQSLDSEILRLATIARIDDKIYVPAQSTEDFEMVEYPSEFQNKFLQAIKNDEDAVALVATNSERIRLNNLARKVKFKVLSEAILPGETIVAVANSAEYRNSEVFNVETIEEISDAFPVKFKFDKGNNTIEEKTYDVIMANIYDEQGKYRNMLMIPGLDKPSLYHGQVMEAAKTNPQLMAFLNREDLIYTDQKGKKTVERSLIIGTYGYAITGHKSQGSQWKTVFINQNFVANTWNPARWYYTAITRASDKVVVLANSNQTKITAENVTQKLSVEESKTKSSDFDYIASSDTDAAQLMAFYNTLNLVQQQKIGTLEDLFKEYKETPFEYSIDEFIENVKTCKL